MLPDSDIEGNLVLNIPCDGFVAGRLNLASQGLQRLKAQVVVGSEDTANDIQIAAGDPLYADGVNDTGSNRVERASFLNGLLRKASVDSRLDVVQGAAHSAAHVQLAVDAAFRTL